MPPILSTPINLTLDDGSMTMILKAVPAKEIVNILSQIVEIKCSIATMEPNLHHRIPESLQSIDSSLKGLIEFCHNKLPEVDASPDNGLPAWKKELALYLEGQFAARALFEEEMKKQFAEMEEKVLTHLE
jgi:hypothetical protein